MFICIYIRYADAYMHVCIYVLMYMYMCMYMYVYIVLIYRPNPPKERRHAPHGGHVGLCAAYAKLKPHMPYCKACQGIEAQSEPFFKPFSGILLGAYSYSRDMESAFW